MTISRAVNGYPLLARWPRLRSLRSLMLPLYFGLMKPMWIRANRAVLYLVIASLAVANGFAPRHAQAAHLHAVKSAVIDHHDQAGGSADAGHHHEQKAAATCHDDITANPLPGSPIHNCCVASCSAVAFIFASVSFDIPLPNGDYHLPPASISIQAALNAADPPPR